MSFSTRIATTPLGTDIDACDWAVIACLSELHGLVNDSPDRLAIGDILERLVEQIQRHLDKEDYRLLSRGEKHAVHRAAHDQLIQYLSDIIHDYDCRIGASINQDVECFSLLFSKHVHIHQRDGDRTIAAITGALPSSSALSLS